MRILSIFLLLFLYTGIPAFTEPSAIELESLIKTEMQRWDVPGLAIAIVVDGEPFLTKGFGVKMVNTDDKVDEQTLFGIASNSKAFNGAMLGVLVDEGVLDWDDKIIKHIPKFRIKDIYLSNQLTIRDLLCHRSGVESANTMWWKSSFSRYEMLQRISHLENSQPIRSGYLYNNLMYLISGMTAELATGKTWNTLVEEKLLTPIGMSNTTTTIKDIIPDGNYATPHARNNMDQIVTTAWYNTDHVAPAASMNSCAVDMAKWIQMWCNKGSSNEHTVLSEKQWDEITSPQNILSTNYMNSISRDINFMAYGLGFRLYEYEGLKFVEHSGHVVTFRSFVCMVPEKKFGVSILTNADTSLPNSLSYEIVEQLLQLEDENWLDNAFQRHEKNRTESKHSIQKRNENRKMDTKPSLQLSSYEGNYENPIYGSFEVILNDEQLTNRYNNSELFKGKLQHWHYDTFLMDPDLDFRDETLITFQLNEHGSVNAVKIDDIFYLKQ